MMWSSSPIRKHEGTCFHSGWSPDGFVLIGLVVLALAPVAALVALAGAILAAPYLLFRTLRRRLADRRRATQGPVPIVTAIAQADPS